MPYSKINLLVIFHLTLFGDNSILELIVLHRSQVYFIKLTFNFLWVK
jgi:hypothetical protein